MIADINVWKCCLFSGCPLATLTSNPPILSSTTCQNVEMTCKMQELQSLSWFFDGNGVEDFSFGDRTSGFPRTIYNMTGIVIQILSAVSESDTTLEFNSSSRLTSTTFALDMLGVHIIECGNRATRSQPINLTMLNIQGIIVVSL